VSVRFNRHFITDTRTYITVIELQYLALTEIRNISTPQLRNDHRVSVKVLTPTWDTERIRFGMILLSRNNLRR
jgi:hypothetical protein